MSNPTYEMIQTVLTSQDIKGATMNCIFTCPASTKTLTAAATISHQEEKEESGWFGKLKSLAAKSFGLGLKSGMLNNLSGMLGGRGMVGTAARAVGNDKIKDVATAIAYNDADKQRAVMAAFDTVAARFSWNEGASRYELTEDAGAVNRAGEFTALLAEHPITEKADRMALARLLVKIASADGELEADEKEMLTNFLAEDLGSVDDVSAAGAPSTDELNAVDAALRPNILMVMWAMAYSDEELEDAEQAYLDEVAGIWGMSDKQAELQELARAYVFNQALTTAYKGDGDKQASEAKALGIASKMGISGDMAGKASAAFKKLKLF